MARKNNQTMGSDADPIIDELLIKRSARTREGVEIVLDDDDRAIILGPVPGMITEVLEERGLEWTIYYGAIGDMSPIEHWGGIVHDQGSGAELVYFRALNDNPDEDGTVEIWRVWMDTDAFDWADYDGIASYIGVDPDEFGRLVADPPNEVAVAQVVESIASYHGWENVSGDQPILTTVGKAEEDWGTAVDYAQRAKIIDAPKSGVSDDELETINRHRASLGMKPIDMSAGWSTEELREMAERIRSTGRMNNPVDHRLKRKLMR